MVKAIYYDSNDFLQKKDFAYIFMKDYELYIDLIGNPFSIKKYKQIANHYRMLGQHDKADAFLYAISIKFNESNDSHTDQEQRKDISQMSGLDNTT
jgi:hypothetical protein